MKKETINNLHQLNLAWSEAAMKCYGEWCKGVMDTLYNQLEPGDKVMAVINQHVKQRPELVPYAHPESGLVILNVSASAVIRFEMDHTGMSFEVGLRGIPLYDHFEWGEIISVEIHNAGKPRYQIPFSPHMMLQFTTAALEPEQTLEAAIPQQPTLESADNVVVANFGQPRRS